MFNHDNDNNKLLKLLGAASESPELQRQLLFTPTRLTTLQEYDLSVQAQKLLKDIRASTLPDFARQSLSALQRPITTSTTSSVSYVLDELKELGFSAGFRHMYERLANPNIGQQADYMMYHFASNISVDQLAQLERQLNAVFRSILREHANVAIPKDMRFVSTRQFSHPGSAEVFLQLAQEVVNSGFIENVNANIVANVFVAGLTSVLARTYRYFVRRRGQENELLQETTPPSEVASEFISNSIQDEFEEIAETHFVKKTTTRTTESITTEKYVGYRDGLYVVGFQTTTETTVEEWSN